MKTFDQLRKAIGGFKMKFWITLTALFCSSLAFAEESKDADGYIIYSYNESSHSHLSTVVLPDKSTKTFKSPYFVYGDKVYQLLRNKRKTSYTPCECLTYNGPAKGTPTCPQGAQTKRTEIVQTAVLRNLTTKNNVWENISDEPRIEKLDLNHKSNFSTAVVAGVVGKYVLFNDCASLYQCNQPEPVSSCRSVVFDLESESVVPLEQMKLLGLPTQKDMIQLPWPDSVKTKDESKAKMTPVGLSTRWTKDQIFFDLRIERDACATCTHQEWSSNKATQMISAVWSSKDKSKIKLGKKFVKASEIPGLADGFFSVPTEILNTASGTILGIQRIPNSPSVMQFLEKKTLRKF